MSLISRPKLSALLVALSCSLLPCASTLCAEEPPVQTPVKPEPFSPQPKNVLGKNVEQWIEYLKNHEIPEERRLAIYCLGEFGPQASAAVPDLIERVRDIKDDDARMLAAEALGQIETAARPALSELLLLFKDPRNVDKLRASCCAAAARIAPEDAECARSILAATRDRSVSVRHAALDALVTLALHGSPSKEILPVLKRALATREDAEVAAAALRCMGSIGTDALVEAVNKGREPEVRQAAMTALARMGDDSKGAREAVLAYLNSNRDPQFRGISIEALAAGSAPDDPELLKVCVNSLGQVNATEQAEAILLEGGPKAAELVKSALKSAVPSARATAAKVLAKLGAQAVPAVDDLILALDDKSSDVSLAAAQALAEIGPPAAAAKTKLDQLVREGQNPAAPPELKDPNRRRVIEQAAVNVSRAPGTPAFTNAWEARSTPQLLRDLKESPYPASRATAALILGKRKDAGDALAPALLAAIKDPEPVVQQSALKSLGSCGKQAAPAFPLLVEWLSKGKDSERKAALTALAGLGKDALAEAGQLETVVPALTTLALTAPADDESMREFLFPAIKAIGAPVFPAFSAAMKDPDVDIEIRACRAMGYMGDVAGPVIKDLSDVTLDPDESVAKAALGALGDIGPPAKAAIPRLVRLLGLDNPARRVQVLKAIDKIGVDPTHKEFKDHMQALLVALLDADDKVAFEAHLVMMSLNEVAIPPLLDMIRAIPEEPPMAALRVLAALKAAPKEIIPLLSRLTWPGMHLEERIVAADLLGIYASKETLAIPALARLMSDRNEDVVRVASRSLRLFGTAAVPELQTLLKGRDPRARHNALRVLEDLKNMK